MKKEFNKLNFFNPLFLFKKKSALTLSEVIITIGVISVIAAMTIPGLMSKYNKMIIEIRLKETYSKLSNMVRLTVAEFGEIDPSGDLTSANSFTKENAEIVFKKYFAPFINISRKYSDSECYDLTKSYGISKNSAQYSDANSVCYDIVNGTSIIFRAGKNGRTSLLYPISIIIYPNKTKKIEGKDKFDFYILFNERGIQFSTFPRVMNLSLTNKQLEEKCLSTSARVPYDGTDLNRGTYCTELLMRNGLKFPSDYPVKF